MGCIPNPLLMCKSSIKTVDYHHQNRTNYEKQTTEMLIPNLPENSVVFDNALYHNVVIDKAELQNYKTTDEGLAGAFKIFHTEK